MLYRRSEMRRRAGENEKIAIESTNAETGDSSYDDSKYDLKKKRIYLTRGNAFSGPPLGPPPTGVGKWIPKGNGVTSPWAKRNSGSCNGILASAQVFNPPPICGSKSSTKARR